MKNLHYFSKSRLLFTLIALFAGISSSWAQKSLPYSYGFETTLADEGWTRESCHSESVINNAVKKTGQNAFRFTYKGTPPQYLISPELAASTKDVTISFWYRAQNTTYLESFKVGYSTTDNNLESFTWDNEETTTQTDVWKEYTNIYPKGVKYIAIQYTADDKYFLWIDDFSVSYPPTCIKPTGLIASDITSNSATLAWTSDADQFNIQYKKTTDSDWTNVSGTVSGSPYTLTGLSSATNYQVRVRTYCDATDQSDWTDAVSFTTDCATITEYPFTENFNGITAGIPMCWNNSEGTTTLESYKWNYYATGHDGACVRFNSYNNPTGNTNMLKTTVMNFTSGKAMQLVFWYKNPAGGDFSVFISNDGGDTYTEELATGLTGASDWTKKEITLPDGFTENVVIVFKGTSNYANGDAYIYLDDVTIQEAPSCIVPTGLTVADITSNGATLNWTSDADNFNVRYKKAGDSDWTEVSDVISGKTYSLTGLTPATNYQVQVRTYCDANDQSVWTDAVSFTTDCVAITAFPYTENFNDITTGIPVCWNNSDGTTTNDAYKWNYYATGHDGACVRFESLYNPNNYTNMLKSPVMNFPTGKIMQLTFWYKNPKAGDFSVYISNDCGATYATALATGLTNLSTWEKKEIILPTGFSENVVIVFKGTSNYSSGDAYIYLDDVTIDEAPACIVPTELAANNATANSVELSWTNGSDEEAWQIAYGTTADFDADAATPIDASANPFTLTGLIAETTYYVCVRSKKGTDVSEWSDKVSFTTLASCITPTDFAVSGLTLNSATLTWTDATEQSQWEVSYSTTSGDPDAGTIVPVTEKTCTITGLTAGTTYYACVRAVNSDTDKSAWSTEISFTPGVLTVNDGTTQNYYVPLYGDYASVATGTQSQFIIPAESLSSIAGNQIDKIAFYCSSASKSWGNASFDVYVKEVESTTFTSTTPSWDGMTKVYSGQLSVANGLMTIQFNEPFEYTNKNLMIGINQTVKGKDSGAYWYGITTTEYTAIDGKNKQNCTFLPKTAIYYSPIVIAPKMVVSETEFNYGLVAQNSEQAKTFTIENKGKAPLEGITVSSSNTAFTVTEVSNQTIDVNGEAITVTVTFDTTTPGDYDGTITVSATGQDNATIAVSGIVRDQNKIFIDFSDSNPMPTTWTMASGWSISNEMAYNNGTLADIISGEVVVAEGGENIIFDYKGANTWGVDYDYIKVYYATTGNDSNADWTLIENATFGCTDNTTWKQAQVTIPNNAKYICLKGKYIYIDNFYGLSNPNGAFFAINTDGTTQDFGFVEPNATAEKTYTITNAGNSDLYLSLDASEGFSIEGGNALLFTSNKGWNSVYVHAWNEEGNLTTWPGNPATYVGKNSNNEDQYAFIVPEGATGIVIDNGGTEQTQDIKNFDVTGYYLKGDLYDGNKYWAESWGTAPSALKVAAGESANITVKISTETPGLKSGNVILNANALNVQSFTIPVTGYVVDESKFYETFANNQLPEGWSDNTGWTFADGKAVAGYDTQMTLPAMTIAEGEKMAISVEATGSNPELFYFISTDGGANWTKSSNIGSNATTSAYSTVYIDGLAAGNYKLKLQGYHVQIDALNGFTLNANAPALAVSPTTAADFGKVTETPEAKTYTVTNTGTGKLTVNIASDSEDFTVNPAKIEDIAAGESSTFTIAFNYTEGNYGDKSATITVTPTYDETAAVTITATATAKNPNVWEEDFEDGSMPTTWNNEGGWTVSQPTASGSNGTYMATISSYNNPKKLTTPRLEAKANETLQFYIGMQYDDEPLTIEYSNDDKATWNVIENGVASYTASGDITFTAPTDGYYYIRFTGTYAMLDNFIGFKLAMKEHDAEITATNIPATGTQYAEYTATVTVKELAGKSEELTAKFFIGETQYGEDVVETVEANGTKTFTVTFTPVEAFSGNAYFTVTNDEISLESEKKAIEIVAAPVFDETEELTYLAEKTEPSLVVKYTPKNGWNTICMPFALTSDYLTAIFGEGWKAWEFNGYTADGVLQFHPATTFYACYPYIIYVAEAAEHADGVILNNVPVKADDANYDQRGDAKFQGTYDPIAAPNMEGLWGVTTEGKIAKGTNTAWMKGFRAYFELPAGTTAARLGFYDETTGIMNVISASELDGDDKAYNMGGQRVQNPKKGLYIVNGKKVVIK